MRSGERFPLSIKICLPLLVMLLLNSSPASYAVMQGLRNARAAQEDGQSQAAADGLRQVLLHEPWRTELWEQIGREELSAGRVAEAADALHHADQAGQLSADGRFWLGDAYLRLGDDRSAEVAWQTLLRVHGPSARVYERLVPLQRKQGNFSGAIATLHAWRSLAPKDSRVAYLLGLFLSAEQPDQAVPLLIEASQKDTQYTPAVQTLRAALGQAAIADQPAYGWLMIGRALGSIEQWDLAQEAFQRAVDLSPGYAEAWAFLGEAHYHLDSSGKTELDKALALNSNSPVVRALLALYWRRQGEPEKALDYLKAIAIQEPKEPTWQIEIANTQVETGDLEAARQSFQKAIDLSHNNSLYYQDLARFSVDYSVDIRSVGLPAARQAVVLAPDDPAALDIMGWTMVYLGDTASAERFLQRALERDATYAPAHLHLGQMYLQQQDTKHAYSYLKQAANLAGEHTQVGIIARRLLLRYYGEGN